MSSYLLRKLASFVPTLLVLMLITFIMLRAAPGNFAYASLRDQPTITPQMVHQAEVRYGLNKPLPVQFVQWLGGILHGDLDKSFYYSSSVWSVITKRLPTTIELVVGASLIGLPVGLLLGIVSATMRDTAVDYAARMVVLTGITLPNFVLGIILLYVLLTRFHYSPSLQYSAFIGHPGANLKEFVWPVALLAIPMGASVARLTRSQLLEVLREDYVRTAKAKGLSRLVILRRHVMRNALSPILGLIASVVGLLLSGTVVVEVLFSLPGIGSGLLLGVQNRDYPLVEGIVLILAFAFLCISFFLDVLYAWLDPRVQYSRG